MASSSSRKRARIDDEDVEVEIESATSSFRQNTHKRSRVAMAQARGGSTVSDEDDDDDEGLDSLVNGFDIDDQVDDAPNHSSEDEDDNDADELKASQIVEKQILKKRGDNVAMECGIIEEVQCKNFMCHGNLRIRLGPLINFIIGHNGSGKSAVLTALQMCLGGKAAATNRGANLKAMIKEGTEQASLGVKIKNRGDAAYKPDLYGDSILVERHFSRTGTSGWKIKNLADKVVSTKRADLDDILDFFAFQLDNPINVLTQDMARQFLSNSTPADKYKFFIQGTQLDVLDADYNVMEENVDSMEAKLRTREEDIAVKRQKAEEAEKRKKRLDASQAIQDKIQKTQRMHAWAQVEEQEAIVTKYSKDVERCQQRIDEVTDAAENISGAYEGHDQAYEAAQRVLREAQAQLEPKEQLYREEKALFDANTSEIAEQKSQERLIKADMNGNKANKKRLDNEITLEQARLAEAEGPEQVERMERLEELKQAAATAEQEELDHRGALPPLEANRKAAAAAAGAAKDPLESKSSELERAQGRLESLKREQQGQKFASFRPNMANLVRAIDSETRWRQKPVGPFGIYVRLLKPEWSSIIEKTFGGMLEAFAVICKEDQVILTAHMNRQKCQAPSFIANPGRFDILRNEPAAQYLTILRALEISNDLVRNTIIINQAPENTALCANGKEAFQLSQARLHGIKVVLAHGGERNTGVRYETTGSKAAKTSPIFAWEGKARMQTDYAAQLRSRQEDVSQLKTELETLRQALQTAERASVVAQHDVNRHQKTERSLRVAKQQAHDAVEEASNEIETSRPQDGKLQEFQRQLENAVADIEATAASFQDLIVEKDKLNDKAKALKQRVEEAQRESDSCVKMIEKAERRKGQLEADRHTALRAKNEALNEIDAAKRNMQEFEDMRDRQQKVLEEDFISEAEKICRRMDLEPGITAATLDKRLEKFIDDYKRAQAEAGGTMEQLTMAWRRAKKELRDILKEQQNTKRLSQSLKNSLTERKYRWRMFLRYIAYRARFTFSYLLSERRFRGRVLMSHEAKTLDISVEPDSTRRSDGGRKTQTLSGGEKSYSTICLLLSIWEAMGSPIRCLDEFDVFMDSVNRSTSMGMMIQAARRSVGRQFVLITPQSMGNVVLGEDVAIHRMSDPERGQTTLV
ncbi:hypothetical protein B0A48_18144 [Cryoendolithus antarcticus]|uniref:RecF/RecN/SMC N-terminal domain-containing protein n=1 Tax=Cryoendolithus antarcticus TaxID=1507870 RepID=A0A1V8S9Z3_9PEZI|nr:hypothetical protein B0A48_18144 [Cryoendolithus antarcticus]